LTLNNITWENVFFDTIKHQPTSAEYIQPLLVGASVPDLLLTTSEGVPLSLNAVIAQQPAILVFGRGEWCGYCKLQLIQLRELEAEISQLGFRLIAITPDVPSRLRSISRHYSLNYLLLSDSGMQCASAFGIAYEAAEESQDFYRKLQQASGFSHRLLPVPSVFIIDTNGFIQFEHVTPNFKERLHPDILLTAARIYG
jgi:peroxiredoxin